MGAVPDNQFWQKVAPRSDHLLGLVVHEASQLRREISIQPLAALGVGVVELCYHLLLEGLEAVHHLAVEGALQVEHGLHGVLVEATCSACACA